MSTSTRRFLRKRPLRNKTPSSRATTISVLLILVAGAYVVFTFQMTGYEQHGAVSTTTTTTTTTVTTLLTSTSPPPAPSTTCKYHGNCPPNTLCEFDTCVPFVSDETPPTVLQDQAQHDRCVQACLVELRMDQRYYSGVLPKVLRTYPSPNETHGCVIQFQQQPVVTQPPPDIGTLDEWIDARFRRLVRVDVDPMSAAASEADQDDNNPTNHRLRWNAFCDHPCESNTDCPAGTECMGRPEQPIAAPVKIHEGPKSCQTPAAAPQTLPKDMVIVTGADQGYYSALRNFAASLKYWAPERRLVVYNLGMSELALNDIKKWTNVLALKWESGIPKSLPHHVHTLKNYAWKPIIINETVHEYKSIFWLDSGATFTGPVDAIEEIIHRNGIFLVRGQDDDMKKLSHPGTYEALGYNKDTFRDGVKSPHYAGGIQGHVYPSRFVDSIVIPNAQCAMDVNCIAPKGSRLGNHRYDQTSLSILAYQATVQAPHYTEYLAAGRDQLNSDLLQPSEKILWTSRGSTNFFSKKFKLKDDEGKDDGRKI
jgi:hypothetical protein